MFRCFPTSRRKLGYKLKSGFEALGELPERDSLKWVSDSINIRKEKHKLGKVCTQIT